MLEQLKHRLRRPTAHETATRVRERRLTYLKESALDDLVECVADLERVGMPGSIVEAGCALGGSAIVMTAAKRPTRELAVFDVFGMIPPPGERDGDDVHQRYERIHTGQAKGLGGNRYYGYEDDLVATVTANFAQLGFPIGRNNVRLVRGLFQDTLPHERGPVALAHIDGDWYDSVMTCLVELTPRLSPGGRLIIDDYDAWSGCRRAVDEYVAAHADAVVVEQHTRPHLVRTSAPL